MEIAVNCPACGTRHLKQIPHEWPQKNGRQVLQMILESQSTNTDAGRMERLQPFADDGQQFTITGEWLDDRRLMLTIGREPREDGAKPKISGKVVTRPELETAAAEAGLKINQNWSDQQLRVALEMHLAAKK